MSLITTNILTVSDPTIKLDPMSMPDAESGNTSLGVMKEKPSKFLGLMIPLVRINEYEVQGDKLISFNLDCNGFIPTMWVTFYDNDTFFQSRHYPKDGDVIQLYIRSQGDEKTFKPIRIDFDVTDCYPIGGGGGVTANRFKLEGRMKIPNMYNEFNEWYNGTSWSTLLKISDNLNLGFASNVDDTSDSMNWINPNQTRESFIKKIASCSYLNDNNFFQVYVDPYYYLTLVDVNRLFNQSDEIEISKTFNQNAGDVIGYGDGEDDYFPHILSNIVQMQGGARYLSKFQLVNSSGSIVQFNGYKRYAQRWDAINKEFLSEYVDPLTTPNTPDMIKLKGRYVGPKGQKIPEGIAQNNQRYKYLGIQDDTVHNEYLYAIVQNFQNNKEINKMGMVVELDTINPALIRFTRIYCHIVEYAEAVKNTLTAENTDRAQPDKAERESTPEEDGTGPFILNEFLSGWYVIKGIEYIYRRPGPLRMKLHLIRREWYPST